MGKIHVVQIAMTQTDGEVYAEYLDDYGRVWYQQREPIRGGESKEYKWVWRQLELPEDPTK